MIKSLFEQLDGTYHEENGYFIPDLRLPAEEELPIGIWGQRHLDYLKQYRKVTYTNLLTSGRLNTYLADIDRQAQERFERLIEGMKQAQGNGTSKGRKRLRMDRTAQQHKGVCKGDCERGNYSNVKDKGGENLTLIFVKQYNFNVKMTVLKIALKPFHHACGHQASFSIGKMDNSIFSVNFFYIIFVYQKCPMATHKIAVQYTC